MVDGALFDKFAEIAQTMRKNPRPWGGIQLIVTGDFFQLPPVQKNGGPSVCFCFDAKRWQETIDLSVNLTKVFRQKDESQFTSQQKDQLAEIQPSSTC